MSASLFTAAPVSPPRGPTIIDRLAEALAAHRGGRPDAAEQGYRAVLAEDPDQPIALHLLGVLTMTTGRPAEAVGLLRRALVERGDDVETRLAYANALAASGERAEAIDGYQAILADDPTHHGALVNLANTLRDTGDTAGAIAACRRALATAPRLVQGHVTLGGALLSAGKILPAIGAYRTAVNLRPDFAPGLTGLAMALLHDRRAIDAVDAATRACEAAPDLAEAWFVRGAAERALEQFAAAIGSLSRAISIEPRHALAHLSLANALLDMDRDAEAEDHLRQAIALRPDLPEAHASLGYLLTGQARLAEAITACDEAIRLRPDFARAYWNRSFAHLLGGDFARGWEDYEWRKSHDQYAADFKKLPGPEWSGEALEGKTLLVHAEQGLGDTIQFARYLPRLARRGARVVLAADRALISLLRSLQGVTSVVARDASLPAYDVWVDQMSLPRLLGTRRDTIPSAQGYLTAELAKVAAWTVPRTAGRRRIGLVWAGNPAHSNDSRRSLPVADLASLVALPGIDWVNLQVGGRGAELAIRYHL
jgi:tetratricopeptide (TPR) repeat protein